MKSRRNRAILIAEYKRLKHDIFVKEAEEVTGGKCFLCQKTRKYMISYRIGNKYDRN